jgi:hypothetical protein
MSVRAVTVGNIGLNPDSVPPPTPLEPTSILLDTKGFVIGGGTSLPYTKVLTPADTDFTVVNATNLLPVFQATNGYGYFYMTFSFSVIPGSTPPPLPTGGTVSFFLSDGSDNPNIDAPILGFYDLGNISNIVSGVPPGNLLADNLSIWVPVNLNQPTLGWQSGFVVGCQVNNMVPTDSSITLNVISIGAQAIVFKPAS